MFNISAILVFLILISLVVIVIYKIVTITNEPPTRSGGGSYTGESDSKTDQTT